MALEYFPCYHSYRRKIAKLSDQEVGRLFRALLEYSETGETQELAGREAVAFDFIADDIDRAKEAYAAKCSQNKKNRTTTNDNERGRTSTDVDERGRTSTDVDERQRTSTSVHKTKDKDKTKDKSKDDCYPPKSPFPVETGGVVNNRTMFADENRGRVISDYLNRVNPSASQRSLEILGGYADSLGPDVCIRAFDIALDNKKTGWSYIQGILRSYEAQGVKCLADVEAREETHRATKAAQRGGTTAEPTTDEEAESAFDLWSMAAEYNPQRIAENEEIARRSLGDAKVDAVLERWRSGEAGSRPTRRANSGCMTES